MSGAKVEFERIAGQIMETDRSYDARINAFHNWYVLDRPLAANGKTPLLYFIDYNVNSLADDIITGYRELSDNLHSVFELVRFSHPSVWLRDLITGKKFLVEGAEQMETMERGDLFNCRVFRHGRLSYLSNYLILHPGSVTRMIKSEAKKLRKTKEDPKPFLFRLLFFHSRWEQFTQMDVNNIYRFETPAHVPKPV